MFEHSESRPILAQQSGSSDALSETELARAASFAGPRRASTTNLEQFLQDAGSSSAGSSSPRSRSSIAPATIVERGAGVCIGALLNLMLCVPFALAYFPIEWHPFPVPRAMGCGMYFLSTVIAQVVLTFQSGFATAQGQMMVENIPFMHAIASVAMEHQGLGEDALGTVLIIWTVGTLFVGAAFFALGHLKVGSIVYHIPRQVIVGCIGGIGIFLVRTCFEVSTGIPFGRDLAAVWPLWGLSVAYEIGLRMLLRCESVTKRTGPLLAPIYFLSIVPTFYLLLFMRGATIHDARKAYFLFPNTEDVSPFLPVEIMAQTVRRGAFSWRAFIKALPTTAMLAIFALMHVPINIPALAATVHVDYDLNHELKLHGVSNLASGLVGGLPNYLGYCNSVMYARCGGGGRMAGIALIVVEALSVAYGMRVVPYVPRCLAGCLILHVGLDLVKEALYDSLGAFDTLEYGCIVAIGFVMTVFGFSSGLLFALVASTLIFTIQQAVHGNPVRGTMRGTTLRSSKWRTGAARAALDNAMGAVLVVQVVGTLFFGNATELKERVAQELIRDRKVTVLILDFTLVRSIDASAAETVGSEICAIAKRHGARVCYASGRADGFPTAAPMTERLLTEQVHVARDLDSAILWAENVLLALKGGPTSPLRPPKSPQLNAPAAQLAVLMPSLSSRDRDSLASHFKGRRLSPGEVLWRQNDPATSIVVVAAGALVSTLEDEAGTAEEVSPGQMCGESAALTKARRASTVACAADGPAQVYVLGSIALAALSPELKLELCLLSMRYMSHRLDHVANRIWETRCVSI